MTDLYVYTDEGELSIYFEWLLSSCSNCGNTRVKYQRRKRREDQGLLAGDRPKWRRKHCVK